MGAASSLLAIVAFLFMVGGMVTSLVPWVGSILSFGAPVVAIFGIVLGGVGMSRAKQMGDSDTFATLGLALNVFAFLFGLLFALTCGVCNACVSQSQQQQGRWNLGPTPSTQSNPWQMPSPPPPGANPVAPTGPSGFTPPPMGPNPNGTDPNANPDPNGVNPHGANPPADPASCRAAEACCRAFFDDPTSCEEVLGAARASDDPAEACTRMAREYRAGLTSLDRPIPSECETSTP
ncbi:MAG: DUF4190 domain-containing protein [Myxococcales bacterium]|nr:DUF4190 domain-containing protein [Myxococcales bacterium]